jgi:magnesium-transporting ATPase (P-type)
MIFVKGPPEMILKVCIEETYPENSYEYIVDMAEKGFKLVCYACK